MAVPYKLQKTAGTFADKEQWRVVVDEHETTQMERLSRRIEHATSMTSGDLMSALIALKTEMVEELKSGNGVHLPGLGYFSLAVKGDLYKDPKTNKMRLCNAHVRTVKFRPEKELMQAFSDTTFENVTYRDGDYDRLTGREVDERLLRLFEEKEVVLATHLRQALAVSRSVLYRLVQQLEAEGKIRNVGTPRRKIFVKGEALK